MKDVHKTTTIPSLQLDQLNTLPVGLTEAEIESAKSLFESGRSSFEKYALVEPDGNSLSSKKLLNQIEPLNRQLDYLNSGDNYLSKRKDEIKELLDENCRLERKNELLENKLIEVQNKIELTHKLIKDKEELFHEVETYREKYKSELNLREKLEQLIEENHNLKRQLELSNKYISRLEAETKKQKNLIRMFKTKGKRICTKREEKLSEIISENVALNQKLENLEIELSNKNDKERKPQTNLSSILESICNQNPHLKVEKDNETFVFIQDEQIIATFKEKSETEEVLDTIPMAEMSVDEEKDQFFRINTEEQKFHEHISILETSSLKSLKEFQQLTKETFALEILNEELNEDYFSIKSKVFLKVYQKKEFFKTKLAIIQERVPEKNEYEFNCKKECQICSLF